MGGSVPVTPVRGHAASAGIWPGFLCGEQQNHAAASFCSAFTCLFLPL